MGIVLNQRRVGTGPSAVAPGQSVPAGVFVVVQPALPRSVLCCALTLILLSTAACSGSRPPVDEWQPLDSVPGAFRRYLVGDTRQPGPYKYQLKIPAGARLAAHKHTVDVHVKVLSGSMFIIIGEPLDSSRAQHFVTGNSFVVPANTWHDEWWDAESVLEAEGVGPMETVYQSATKLISRVDHCGANRDLAAIRRQALTAKRGATT